MMKISSNKTTTQKFLIYMQLILIGIMVLPILSLAQFDRGDFSTDGEIEFSGYSTFTAYFFVAPHGKPSGDGSINNPWDLQTALNQPTIVKPGSIIWLRGGVYRVPQNAGGFVSNLEGLSNAPIKVMSYGGEWAVLDGNLSGSEVKNKIILKINGTHTWFMNFEITNSETTNRKISVTGSNPLQRRGSALYDYGTGTKVINLVIHDAGQGIGAWSQGKDNEYYGNIIYNNGWDAPDRLHGHGTYVQNTEGYKKFDNNIFFNPFGQNSRMGGTGKTGARNFTWTENVFFNGSMAWDGPNISNLSVLGNYTYNNLMKFGTSINLTNTNADVRNNYFMTGVELFEFGEGITFRGNTVWNHDPAGKSMVLYQNTDWSPSKFTINNNTYYKSFNSHPYWQFKVNYYGPAVSSTYSKQHFGYMAFNKTSGSQAATFAYTGRSWRDIYKFDTNSTYNDYAPPENKIVIQSNRYDSKRANLIIYNWENLNYVDVNLDSLLKEGDRYEIRNVQDYFGDVISGTYNGKILRINMTNRTRAKPIGYDQVSSWYHDPLEPNTFPTFGAFVIKKTN